MNRCCLGREPNVKHIREKLDEMWARVAAGLIHAQVATRIKTSQASVVRMEGGKVKPSADPLEKHVSVIVKRPRIPFEPLNSI